MLESLQNDWYLWLLLVVAAVGVAVLWKKAMAVSKKRSARVEAELAALRHEAQIKKDYAAITPQALAAAPADTIWEGAVARIQAYLEQAENMNDAFEKLPDAARVVYTAYYLQEKDVRRLRDFFRQNGEPLTGMAEQALRELGAEEAAQVAALEYEGFDEDNESVSLDPAVIAEQDERYRAAVEKTPLAPLADAYIRAHAAEICFES